MAYTITPFNTTHLHASNKENLFLEMSIQTHTLSCNRYMQQNGGCVEHAANLIDFIIFMNETTTLAVYARAAKPMNSFFFCFYLKVCVSVCMLSF